MECSEDCFFHVVRKMEMLSLKKKSKLNEEVTMNQADILSIDLCCPTLPKARTSMVLAYVVAVTTLLCFPLEVAAQQCI